MDQVFHDYLLHIIHDEMWCPFMETNWPFDLGSIRSLVSYYCFM